MEWYMIAYILVLLCGVLVTGVYWYINRPIVDMSGPSPGITAMLFDDDCRTYMDPSSGVVSIDQTCKCCSHHRGGV